jgi:hypothetical protein
MARFYHVDIARFAADADQKWVDNLLSHYDVPGVEGAKQGLARRISTVGVYHIALVRSLTRDAGVSTATAVSLSVRLLTPGVASIPVITGLEFRFDREVFERHIDQAISEAVESVAPARRGRPPKRSEGSPQGSPR